MSSKLLLAAVALALPTVATPAPIFSNVVSNQNELSYDISGTVQSIAGGFSVDLTNAITFGFDTTVPWAQFASAAGYFAPSLSLPTGGYEVIVSWMHVNGAPFLGLNSGFQPFGTEYSSSMSRAHDSAIDSFSLTIRVDAAVEGLSAVSGRVELIHQEATAVSGPGTLALLGLGLSGLAAIRRKRT